MTIAAISPGESLSSDAPLASTRAGKVGRSSPDAASVASAALIMACDTACRVTMMLPWNTWAQTTGARAAEHSLRNSASLFGTAAPSDHVSPRDTKSPWNVTFWMMLAGASVTEDGAEAAVGAADAPGTGVTGTGVGTGGEAVPGTGVDAGGDAVSGTGVCCAGDGVPGTGVCGGGAAVSGTGVCAGGDSVAGTGVCSAISGSGRRRRRRTGLGV